MKAIAWTAYGPPDVLQIKDVAKPAPKANEPLIKVHAATVTTGDCELRSYPLAQTAEAHSYVEQGHKKDNVVITME